MYTFLIRYFIMSYQVLNKKCMYHTLRFSGEVVWLDGRVNRITSFFTKIFEETTTGET